MAANWPDRTFNAAYGPGLGSYDPDPGLGVSVQDRSNDAGIAMPPSGASNDGGLFGAAISIPANIDDLVLAHGEGGLALPSFGRDIRAPAPLDASAPGGPGMQAPPGGVINSVDSLGVTAAGGAGSSTDAHGVTAFDPVYVTAKGPRSNDPIYGDPNIIPGTVSPDAPLPYLVSRTIFQPGGLGVDVGKHEFVVVGDRNTGQKSGEWHYGPSGPAYSPGRLVELRDALQSATRQGDDAAWAARDAGNPWWTSIRTVPASAAAVEQQGNILDQYLGTPEAPGPTPYLAVPRSGIPAANSNTAAQTLVNNAIQSEHPGAAFFGPPDSLGRLFPSLVAPGGNHSLSGAGNNPLATVPSSLPPFPPWSRLYSDAR